MLLEQLFEAGCILVRGHLLRLQRLCLRQGLAHRRLEGTRVEFKQQLVLLDHIAVLKMDFLDVPAHPRPHVDRLGCLQPAVVVILVHQAPDDRMGHGDPGRLLGLVGAGRGTTARDDQGN